jgi:hypothetical protein
LAPYLCGSIAVSKFYIIVSALIAASGAYTPPALAYEQSLGDAQQSTPPERISFLVTFGSETCPAAIADEIVVCAAQPESERYRVPKSLRKTEDAPVRGGSWTSAVESLDGNARAVLPNSCSVNGSNGFTGCTQQALQAWFAERRGKSEGR